MAKSFVNIKNRKAKFEYIFEKVYTAGIELKGTEVKSIRDNNVSLNEAYCIFHKDELYVKNMYIKPYENAYVNKNHDDRRERKLLLKRSELNKLKSQLETKGLTIVPIRMFTNDKNLVKLEIALAKGKKLYDKRQTLKEKDLKREKDRVSHGHGY